MSPTGKRPVAKEEVKAFWEAEACGERYGAGHDHVRYQLEPQILPFADFGAAKGKKVLEVGIGLGADLVRWARAGAVVTGVDLTERAVSIARQRLAGEGLRADIYVGDAERLPFDDDQFDVVYSWGVLHHTPDPAGALAEAERVLAPGGRLKIMVYHRRSWVALAAWVRFCLLRGRPFASLREAVGHVESPGTQAFTPGEVRAMISRTRDLSVRPVLTRWDRRWAPGLSRLLGDRLGWFLLVEGTKAPTGTDPVNAAQAG